MGYSAHEAYLESRVLSADPIELVRMLYQGATGAVREARRSLADGDIAARSRSIRKAYEILAELTTALDHARGGEISLRLAALYDYMQRRLIDANLQQQDAPLAEVLRLLSTLAEGWDGVQARAAAQPQPEPEPAAPVPNAWTQQFAPEPEPLRSYQSWSL